MATHTPDPVEYEVSVSCLFEADDPIDAVKQMVEWISESARVAAYRVTDNDGYSALIDAEDWQVFRDPSLAESVPIGWTHSLCKECGHALP